MLYVEVQVSNSLAEMGVKKKMKANLARDILLEISFLNREKNEVLKLVNSLHSDIEEIRRKKDIGIKPNVDTIIKKGNKLESKLVDIEPLFANDTRKKIQSGKADVISLYKAFPKFIHGASADTTFFETFVEKLRTLNKTLMHIFDELIGSRINIPSYEDFKHIKNRLRYQNENPVFTRQSIQIYRRIWHMVGGLVLGLSFLFVNSPMSVTIPIFAIIAAIVIAGDLGRLKIKTFNDRIAKDFKWLIRDKEKASISTMTYFLSGSLISLLLFPKEIAIASILFLAVGDPVASIVGIRFGKNRILWGKSVEGFLACFIACYLISYMMFANNVSSSFSLFIFSILSALTVSIAEVLPFKYDDNLTIPVLSGFVMSCLSFILF